MELKVLPVLSLEDRPAVAPQADGRFTPGSPVRRVSLLCERILCAGRLYCWRENLPIHLFDRGEEVGVHGCAPDGRVRMYVRPRWIVVVVLLPFVLLGLLISIVEAYDLVRYNPAYFADEYLERYSNPGDTARAMEEALQTSDHALLAELQGLRWPAKFQTGPSMIFVMRWERTDRRTMSATRITLRW